VFAVGLFLVLIGLAEIAYGNQEPGGAVLLIGLILTIVVYRKWM
jgi:hypothetical protein